MLKWEPLAAKIGFDTAENRPSEVWATNPQIPTSSTGSYEYLWGLLGLLQLLRYLVLLLVELLVAHLEPGPAGWLHRSIMQTLQGSFSAVSKLKFAIKMRLKTLVDIYTMHSFALL